jgi:hypothetical protein
MNFSVYPASMSKTMPSRNYLPTTWYDSRVEICLSSIQGNGMAAARPIHAGETVVVIGGTVLTTAQFQAFTATATRYNAVQIGEDAHLVDLPTAPGGMNHSWDSNLWMGDEVTVVARRAIAAGAELTIDYALQSGLPVDLLGEPCRCGLPACRGVITGNDWQRKELQERYQGHFSPFLNERIRCVPG